MRFVAFIRAVNVRGRPPLPMTVARRAFVRAGATNVASFLQSGNVLFDAKRPCSPLFTRIRSELATALKAEPVVMFRELASLRAVLAAAPFTTQHSDGTAKLYVAFLERAPRRRPALPLSDEKEGLELIGMRGAHAFVVSRAKSGKAFHGMPNPFVEKACRQRATCRYVSTLTRLLARALD